MMQRGISWLRMGIRLERWQWILASALVGAAMAVLAVEAVSLPGDLLDVGWLRDVGNNVDGPTASAGGAAAGAGAAVGGDPTRRDPSYSPSDPRGPAGETPEQRANREHEEGQRRGQVHRRSGAPCRGGKRPSAER